MNEADLLAAAAKDMRASKITVREWIKRVRNQTYPWEETHIGEALLTLEKVKRVKSGAGGALSGAGAGAGALTPVPPPALTLQRSIFWAQVSDDAVQHACRLSGWRHALSADPAYAPTVEQVNALKGASAGVDAWGNQSEIPYADIVAFRDRWRLDRILLQAETIGEFETAMNAWGLT